MVPDRENCTVKSIRGGCNRDDEFSNVSLCGYIRRGGQWLTCRTHASLHGYGNVSVSVSIDKAHLQKDLPFEYVEDPTITKIEPEWSIYR